MTSPRLGLAVSIGSPTPRSSFSVGALFPLARSWTKAQAFTLSIVSLPGNNDGVLGAIDLRNPSSLLFSNRLSSTAGVGCLRVGGASLAVGLDTGDIALFSLEAEKHLCPAG